ncbi:MAG: hypothetical protein HOV79_27005 [Hamadaea sp.]|nr:hypothetical protein [Hamadaea sp.]
MLTIDLLQRSWTRFRRPGRLVTLAAATLVVIAFGLLYAFGNRADCAGECPVTPTTADGSAVSDRFWFLHRDLGENGSVTARLTAMTGTITYPPPDHDEIVPGLVPWAKTGLIIKDGTAQGSAYAALAMTGAHGVRFQYDYVHDVTGGAGGVSTDAPRWLRLVRAGDTITGYESADGEDWREVGRTTLPGLPETVQVGFFAASPGDLTLRRTGLGGVVEEVRFTQATGVFDSIDLAGAPAGGWRSEAVGGMNHTDWEKHHNASAAAEKDGVVTISGTGEIGPQPEEGARIAENLLPGLVIALILLLISSARFGARATGSWPQTAADAVVVAGAAVASMVVAVGIVVPAGLAVLTANGIPVQPLGLGTGTRVVLGVAAAVALSAVLAYALGRLLRRGWLAALIAVTGIAVPYAVAAFPFLPDDVSRWLLRLTPAAGFAVQQTAAEFPQVTAHYAPSSGYFPLPWWAGLAVLCAYTLVALTAMRRTERERTTDFR